MGKKRLFSVIYEDQEILVADKPAGLLAVPIRGSKVDNLLDYVSAYVGKSKNTVQAVHRIDRYTSGLMVFAKTERSYEHLKTEFMENRPERIYLALVRGKIKENFGELRHNLKLIRKGFRNVVVPETDTEARRANLEYEVIERFDKASLVAVRLGTGLKNQIRVQFADFGHPLIGDQHYSPEEKHKAKLNRQALHAYRLEFDHPVLRKMIRVEAELPEDLQRLLKQLSNS